MASGKPVPWNSELLSDIEEMIDNRNIVSYGNGKLTFDDQIKDMTVAGLLELQRVLGKELKRLHEVSEAIIDTQMRISKVLKND